MPISIRQLAYGTVSLHWTFLFVASSSFFFYLQHQLVSRRLLEQSITTALQASELNYDQKHLYVINDDDYCTTVYYIITSWC